MTDDFTDDEDDPSSDPYPAVDGSTIARLFDYLDAIITTLERLELKMNALDSAFQELVASVNAEETVEAATLTYLQGIPGLLTAMANSGQVTSATDLINLSNKIGADTASLTNALNNAPQEGAVAPPTVSGNTTTPVDGNTTVVTGDGTVAVTGNATGSGSATTGNSTGG